MEGFVLNIPDAMEFLVEQVPDPSLGLPDDVFYYMSRLTPLVNVDLLIKDEKGRTLLAWRDDQFSGQGWHVPGGIVRVKEAMETRVRTVAETEIGVDVSFDKTPIAINEFIHNEREVRSHFVSILYRCFLPGSFVPANKGLNSCDKGFLMWHETCPDRLLKCHGVYIPLLMSAEESGKAA